MSSNPGLQWAGTWSGIWVGRLLDCFLLFWSGHVLLRLFVQSHGGAFYFYFSLLGLLGLIAAVRPVMAIALLAVCTPFISGLHETGLFEHAPVLQAGVGIIFAVRYGVGRQWEIRDVAPSVLETCINGFLLLVALSALMLFWGYPVHWLVERWMVMQAPGQLEFFHGVEAGYIVVMGPLLLRMMLREGNDAVLYANIPNIILAQGLLIACFIGYQYATGVPALFKSVSPTSPFRDPHSFASATLLCSFALASTIRHSGNLWRLVLLVMLVGSVFISGSRIAWAAMALGACGWSLLRPGRTRLAIGLAAVAVSCLVGWFVISSQDVQFNTVLDKLSRASQVSLQDKGIVTRVAIWQRALNMAGQNTLFGAGVGRFFSVSSAYQGDGPHVGAPELNTENAHSYFLQILGDMGLPALALFCAVVALAAYRGVGREATAFDSRLLFFGLAAYCITCITGHPLLLPEQQIFFWFWLGMLGLLGLSGSQRQEGVSISRARQGALYVLVFAVVAGGMAMRQADSLLPYQYGFHKQEMNNGVPVHWIHGEAGKRVTVTGDVLVITAEAAPFNIKPQTGLDVQVLVGKTLVGTMHFDKAGTKTVLFDVKPWKDRDKLLVLKVSEVFNPRSQGISRDNRDLGVLIKQLAFIQEGTKR